MIRITHMIGIVIFLSQGSCYGSSSLTPSGPRTILLDREPISEDAMGGFVSWTCHDDPISEDILVEVEYFEVSNMELNGFILYDGGYSGDFALYMREGLEHNWIWGDG